MVELEIEGEDLKRLTERLIRSAGLWLAASHGLVAGCDLSRRGFEGQEFEFASQGLAASHGFEP